MKRKGVALTGLLVAALFVAPARPLRRVHRLESPRLAAVLDSTGFRLEPSGWGLTPSAWGRPGSLQPLVRTSPLRTGGRVRYVRPGILEWHEARPEGIEQAFEIAERPEGEGPLVVEQEVRGGIRLVEAWPDGLSFGSVEYRGLKAFDAGGRPLPARMALSGRRLALVVEDAGATYPVSIDPLSAAASWVFEPNRASVQCSHSVDSAGDVNGDGYSDVILSAPLYDNAEASEGRAYVFHGGSGGLSATPAWTVETNQTNAFLGYSSFPGSVAGAGDVNGDGYSDVVVGVLQYDNGQSDEGRVYLYHGSATGLSTAPAWVVESQQTLAYFGDRVASAGDVNADGFSDVAVGDLYYDNGETNEGRVYVFLGASSGLSTLASWVVECNQESASFGSSVWTAGDVNGDGFSDLAVGAYAYDNGETNEGRAYVYHGSSAGLSTTASWVWESNWISCNVGGAISGAGDLNGDGFSDLAVGAHNCTNGHSQEGRAYVFHGSAAGLSTTATWVAEGDQNTVANYGASVGQGGDVDGDGYSDLAVGCPRYTNGLTSNEGRAFLYHGSATGPSAAASWTTEPNQSGPNYGNPVHTAGDVDGDGFSDLIVGCNQHDNAESNEGRAFVFHGGNGTVAYTTYDLPGFQGDATPDPGDARLNSLQSRVVRDSNGFWYVAWNRWNQAAAHHSPVYLAYTTTSTPTSAADWTTLTAVDSAGTGVIAKAPANNGMGLAPVLAMSNDDQLHLAWMQPSGNFMWSKCTDLSALTVDASWATPLTVQALDAGIYGQIDLAVDDLGVPHAAFTEVDNGSVQYTKLNTATTSFYSAQELDNGTSSVFPRIALDLDQNVYVTFQASAAPFNVSLICSTNAYTTSPVNASWRNLGQTLAGAEVVNTPSTTMDALTAADLCVDYNNICHVVWRVAAGNPNGQCIVARDGRINQGWAGAAAQVSAPGPWKRPVAMVAIPDGSARLFSIANGGSKNDAVYWTQYTGVGDPIELGSWSVSPTAFSGLPAETSQAIWAERRMPRNRAETLWFLANDAKHRISTSWTDRFTTSARWSPPIQEKRKPHPHLAWVFPSTASDCGTLGLPVVSQTSKSCVYVMDPAGGTTTRTKILAVDRSRGSLARSYYTGRLQQDPMIAAAWGGNVHLFVSQTGGNILKLADTGTSLLWDAAWGNNPQKVAGRIWSTSFLTESTGVRYLYVAGNIAALTYQQGLYKHKADNGVRVWSVEGGFGDYSTTTTEHPFRVLNDQIFIAGNVTGLFRMDSDSSGEISATAIVNNVRKLIQVRNGDRLFVSPDDRVVYQLTSGLATTGWTSGKSANLGATKTSGAYYARGSDSLYVGAGNQLFRLNAADGGILSNWPMAYAGCIPVLPVQWRTFVYFGMSSGRLFAVNATTNVSRANWPVVLDTTVSTPAVRSTAFDAVYGHVYFSTDEGRIFKFALE